MNASLAPARVNNTHVAAGFAVLFAVYHFHEFFQSLTISAITLLTFMVVSYVVARAQQLRGLQSWGLGMQQHWWVKLALGLAAGMLFVSLSTAASVYLGYERATASPGATVFFKQIWWIMFMTFWPSLAEDILTRGYLYKHFGHRMPPYTWVAFSAVVYVLNHIWRLTDHPAVLTYLFILGLVLATAMVLTKSMWLTLGIHWGANILYYVSVDIFAVEAVVDGRESTWVLAAAYLLLLVVMLLTAGVLQKSKTRKTASTPGLAYKL
ncbi:CPBP family intramembrane glutamic endopeptidase [uncultured Pontibacter sp.]|uniref:CPBP family intramembrane glutamic endopeptidase n=1 Tax=uncultured Pontibacter sp. TaxID=453356 RepID=UPI00262FC124|nr:CPBP family intramembrane glutamic endopeptidase [uncultured Pontibacter sp.]